MNQTGISEDSFKQRSDETESNRNSQSVGKSVEGLATARVHKSPSSRPVYPKDVSVDRYGFIRQDRSCYSGSTANVPNDCRHGSLSQRLQNPFSSASSTHVSHASGRSTVSNFRRCGVNIPEKYRSEKLNCRSLTIDRGKSPAGNSEQTFRSDDQSDGEIIISDNSSIGMTDVMTLQRHELKWLDMFRNWPAWMGKNFVRLKRRCRKGIPMSVRGRAWRYLSGAVVMENLQPTLFSELALSEDADPRVLAEITKDLHRSFPNHELFYSTADQSQYNDLENLECGSIACSGLCTRETDNDDSCASHDKSMEVSSEAGGSSRCTCEGTVRPRGQSDLYSVLKAYSLYNKKAGYCQALAPIASVLLMHLPANQAFWVLVCICRFYMRDYYDPGLEQFKRDGDLLRCLLLRLNCPCLNLLADTEPILYMTEWFMCLYSRSLPWASVLRVWDMFFCEGPKVLFKVAIAWLNTAFGHYKTLKQDNGHRTSLGDLMDYGRVDFDSSSCKSMLNGGSQWNKCSTSKDSNSQLSHCNFDFMSSIEEQGELLKIIKQTPQCLLNPTRLFKKIARIRITDRQLADMYRHLDKRKL